MKYHGLLMKPDLIRATLAGIKTVTRRIPTPRNTLFDGGTWPKELVKDGAYRTALDWKNATIDPGPSPAGNRGPYLHVRWPENETTHRIYPRIQPGDRIYVKEAFVSDVPGCGAQGGYSYRVDHRDPKGDAMPLKWNSPMFMPREAARIVREVWSVGYEFLQDITESEAYNEGIIDGGCLNCGEPEPCFCKNMKPSKRDAFIHLWDSINAERGYPWSLNPIVMPIRYGKENCSYDARTLQ